MEYTVLKITDSRVRAYSREYRGIYFFIIVSIHRASNARRVTWLLIVTLTYVILHSDITTHAEEPRFGNSRIQLEFSTASSSESLSVFNIFRSVWYQ